MFPLVRVRASVLLEGERVNLEDISASFGGGVATPPRSDSPASPWRSISDEEAADVLEYYGTDANASMDRFSMKFQWLPCEVSFVHQEADIPETSSTQVRISSCINNLHPDQHKDLHRVIEEVITASIEPWNDCLIYGNRPRAPMRIRTYGTGPKDSEHPEPVDMWCEFDC